MKMESGTIYPLLKERYVMIKHTDKHSWELGCSILEGICLESVL